MRRPRRRRSGVAVAWLAMPAGTVMGVPTDLRLLAASGLLTPWELARIPLDRWLPATDIGEDIPVGRLVGARLGRAVVDRLVEPLLGGCLRGSRRPAVPRRDRAAARGARTPGALAAGGGPRRSGERPADRRSGVRQPARRPGPCSPRRSRARRVQTCGSARRSASCAARRTAGCSPSARPGRRSR